MCGRFVLSDARWAQDYDIDEADLHLSYNIKPTQGIALVTPKHEVAIAHWWLIPSWHKGDLKDWKATTFNARIEDASAKPTFRAVWKYGRCLIPATGYYEWTGEKGSKQPHFISSDGNEDLMWFAGLASRWQDILTCTIMTRAANETIDQVHHRMPVILNTDEQGAWLDGSNDLEIGAGAQLKHHPVKKFGITDDGPELIEPFE